MSRRAAAGFFHVRSVSLSRPQFGHSKPNDVIRRWPICIQPLRGHNLATTSTGASAVTLWPARALSTGRDGARGRPTSHQHSLGIRPGTLSKRIQLKRKWLLDVPLAAMPQELDPELTLSANALRRGRTLPRGVEPQMFVSACGEHRTSTNQGRRSRWHLWFAKFPTNPIDSQKSLHTIANQDGDTVHYVDTRFPFEIGRP